MQLSVLTFFIIILKYSHFSKTQSTIVFFFSNEMMLIFIELSTKKKKLPTMQSIYEIVTLLTNEMGLLQSITS